MTFYRQQPQQQQVTNQWQQQQIQQQQVTNQWHEQQQITNQRQQQTQQQQLQNQWQQSPRQPIPPPKPAHHPHVAPILPVSRQEFFV